MKKVLAALIAVGALMSSSAASAAPPSPGDSKNCGDFGTWNEAQVWYQTYERHYGDVGRLDADNDFIPCEANHGAPDVTQWQAQTGGYVMLESAGTVFGFGDMRPVMPIIRENVSAIALGPAGGYWVVTPSGVVHARGVAHHGNAAVPAGDSATSIAGMPDGSGYWVFTSKGRTFAFGAAQHFGDMSATPLNGGVIASVATPTGRGYWMVGSDGGIFTFGDARFFGSTGAMSINQPVVGMAPDPDGVGYWLVAADGGMFSFDAPFRGSVPGVLRAGQGLNSPVVGAISYGSGYLMVASDGGIFSFSDRAFFGSLGSTPPPNPVVAVAVR